MVHSSASSDGMYLVSVTPATDIFETTAGFCHGLKKYMRFNFQEVEGAYCFYGVCPFICSSFYPSFLLSRFLMHSISLEMCMLLF